MGAIWIKQIQLFPFFLYVLNETQHEADVVIEMPEPGKAVQMGRFNQAGEINIFSD